MRYGLCVWCNEYGVCVSGCMHGGVGGRVLGVRCSCVLIVGRHVLAVCFCVCVCFLFLAHACRQHINSTPPNTFTQHMIHTQSSTPPSIHLPLSIQITTQAAAPKPPALLEVVSSLASSPHLAPVLAGQQPVMADVSTWDDVLAGVGDKQTQKQGGEDDVAGVCGLHCIFCVCSCVFD